MLLSRQNFSISTDTGQDWTDTGPVFSGAVLQVHYIADNGGSPLDTGADLRIELLQPGDTGANIQLCKDDNSLGASFNKIYKIYTHDTGGQVSSEDYLRSRDGMLRVSVTHDGTGAKKGKLHILTGDI